MAHLTVGKLAKACGVGAETIRFYEKTGLMPEPERLSSGYRVYDEKSIARLNFIQKAKNIGFSLQETKELLALSDSPNADCGDSCDKADEKITDIELRIQDLTAMKQALTDLRKICPGEGNPLNECVILKYFYGEHDEEDD